MGFRAGMDRRSAVFRGGGSFVGAPASRSAGRSRDRDPRSAIRRHAASSSRPTGALPGRHPRLNVARREGEPEGDPAISLTGSTTRRRLVIRKHEAMPKANHRLNCRSTGCLEHVRHILDISLGQTRREGQGKRGRGDALRYRKLAPAESEGIAVDRLQMERTEIRSRWDADRRRDLQSVEFDRSTAQV